MNRALSAMDQTLANTAMNTISGVDVDDEGDYNFDADKNSHPNTDAKQPATMEAI